MIYLARTVFLIGSSCTAAGVVILILKLMYEPVLPEVMQGQWPLLFIGIFFSVLYTAVGQYLGNDLLGVGSNVNDAADRGYKHFRRQDKFTQYFYLRWIYAIIRSIQN